MPTSKHLSTTLLLFLFIAAMAGLQSDAHKPEDSAIYIVYTSPKEGDESHEAFHINILKEAFGGDESSAKEKILYHYTTAAHGFSAKLTPAQADFLSKRPHVVQVVPEQTVPLHTNPTHHRHT
ncbi:unnamed protein product [Cuscuta epithymum]|uniref:Inhibitor I9 domain-containing protein n=1 Tax=Cuscuta epithymum TaxID=186058 RepID=A0AAV0FNA2_9ASTE|nr:unnamed protein product [Cuscuta epithymum]